MAQAAQTASATNDNSRRDAVLQAALALFYAQGFHGTSMRAIADRAGTALSHAYYYFSNKNNILRTLMADVTEDLLRDLKSAREAADADPAAQLAAIVRAHVLFHTQRQAESFVGNTELRSLDLADRKTIIALRDHVSKIFKSVVSDGIDQRQFSTPHAGEAVRAIVTMCTAVAGWYRSGGPDMPEKIANRYVELALRMVGAPTR